MRIWLSEIWRSRRAGLRKPGFLLLASGVLALDIGVCMAMGAKPLRLLRMVVRRDVVQILLGLAARIGVALALVPMASSLLVDLTGSPRAFDSLTLTGVAAILAMAGLVACLLPALCAAHTPPMRALRGE